MSIVFILGIISGALLTFAIVLVGVLVASRYVSRSAAERMNDYGQKSLLELIRRNGIGNDQLNALERIATALERVALK